MLTNEYYYDSEFQPIAESSGLEVAASYAIAKICIGELAQVGEDDWLLELIRKAYAGLGEDAKAKLAENGF